MCVCVCVCVCVHTHTSHTHTSHTQEAQADAFVGPLWVARGAPVAKGTALFNVLSLLDVVGGVVFAALAVFPAYKYVSVLTILSRCMHVCIF